MGAVTGKGFAALIRERFGVRPDALRDALPAHEQRRHHASPSSRASPRRCELFGVSKYISVPIAAVVVWLLVVRGSYRNVEKVLLALSRVFLAYIIAAFMAKPDWGAVAQGHGRPAVHPDAGVRAASSSRPSARPSRRGCSSSCRATSSTRASTVKELPLQRVDVDRRRRLGQHRGVVHHRDHRHRALPARHRDHRAPSRPRRRSRRSPGSTRARCSRSGCSARRCSRRACCRSPRAYAISEAFGWERGIDRTWAEAPVFNAHLHLRHRLRRGVRAHPRRAAHHDHGPLAGGQRRAAAVPAHLHDDHRQRPPDHGPPRERPRRTTSSRGSPLWS